ncbi:MAG TPA: hypothetical protein VFV99_15635 [Kofleriaceae bacterium]|nr:hypothetical protein [Kofleriaceae bacterium]
MGWALLLLCGCNQVFGLRETIANDAQLFDAPIDAPFTCPDPAMQPQFSKILHQVITKNCQAYMTSPESNRAVAYCVDMDVVVDGVIDAEPQPATLTPVGQYDWPRLTPEGDEIWVRDRRVPPTFAVFQWQSDHTWAHVRDLVIANVARDDYITAPSRKVGGKRRFVRLAFSEFKLYEYDDDGTTTTPIRSYNLQLDLGVDFASFPNLDASGLRLVFVGQTTGTSFTQTFYASRASIDDSFSPAKPLLAAPLAYDPFLTPDCSRLYTSGLGSIFYAQQL